MATREFVDSKGVAWRVWNTAGSRLLTGDYATGWLTFESSDMLKRLAPIPADWESVPEERLELLCRQAEEKRRISAPQERIDDL